MRSSNPEEGTTMMNRSVAAFSAVVLLATGGVLVAGHAYASPGPALSGTDSRPVGRPEVAVPPQYRAAGEGEKVRGSDVYFTPQDENTSTTILFLYNTTKTDRRARIRTWTTDGTANIDTTIQVPARHL